MVKPDCSDYLTIGDYTPISFEPKLKWKLVQSRQYDNPNLARHLTFEATVLPGKKVIVHAHPYGYGEFTADGYPWGFGSKNCWLGTKDPEEALYLTEQLLISWCNININFYTRILNRFNDKEQICPK